MEAVKPLLGEGYLVFSDKVEQIGDQLYVAATVTLYLDREALSATGYARETMDKKKYDSSQLTGSASSYARKYAANGLFCLDDIKDPDNTNNQESKPEKEEINWYNDFDNQKDWMIKQIANGSTADKIINLLKSKGYALSKKVSEQIKGLD